MTLLIKKIELYVNTTKENAYNLSKKIEEKLTNLGYIITDDNPDLVIGFGGDGTLINFLRSKSYITSAKYIGVNCGTLGFLQDFNVESIDEFTKNIPNYVEENLDFISLSGNYNDNYFLNFLSLNEFYIASDTEKPLRMKVQIGDEFLEDYVGTGIIFSSPTGSTARNLSSVGSIIFPKIKAFQMTPSEAIVNKAMRCLPKSICIPKGYTVTLTPNLEDTFKIVSDGNKVYSGNLSKIQIEYSDFYMTKLTNKENTFISKHREKLIL